MALKPYDKSTHFKIPALLKQIIKECITQCNLYINLSIKKFSMDFSTIPYANQAYFTNKLLLIILNSVLNLEGGGRKSEPASEQQ